MGQTAPIDYVALAAKLGLTATCVLDIHYPERKREERPALDGHALTVTLSETFGPWRDSPPRPILTITHRATGLTLSSVAGPYPADRAGLKRAAAACKLLRKAPGFTWEREDPNPEGVPAAVNAAALRELVGDLAAPEAPKPRARKLAAGRT